MREGGADWAGPSPNLTRLPSYVDLEVHVWDADRVESSQALIVPEHNCSVLKGDLVAIKIPAGRHLRAHRFGREPKMNRLKLIALAQFGPGATMFFYILPEQVVEITLQGVYR